MRSKALAAELLCDARATLGEGPVWDRRRDRLLWVDIASHHVHALEPSSGALSTWNVGQPVGSVAICSDGKLIAALRDGVAVLAAESGAISEFLGIEADTPENRMNDGKCDCRGRFWAGTMAADHRKDAGTLYRVQRGEGGLAFLPMLRNITVANGLDWSLDNSRMYYIDSATQRIDMFDFDPEQGALLNRRPFVEIPVADGFPDGMTVDADDHVWVALFWAGKVRRYHPSGRIDMEVHVPARLVTSCAFGGPDFELLYITTARHRLSAEEAAAQTTAGGVFVCRPGPNGRAPFTFGEAG